MVGGDVVHSPISLWIALAILPRCARLGERGDIFDPILKDDLAIDPVEGVPLPDVIRATTINPAAAWCWWHGRPMEE
jgi:hypothetical protein